jgi:hypothetical protein
MNQFKKLKELATGKQAEVQETAPFSAASQQALRQVDEWKISNADMEPNRKYSKLFGMIEELHIDDDNRDYLYNELHDIHPVSPEKSKEFLNNHFTDYLNSVPQGEMEGYIQDTFKKFPTEMLPAVQDVFVGLKAKNAAKDFRNARVAVYSDVKNILKKGQWSGLDANKSLDAHARSFLKVYDNDLTGIAEIHAGNISFSTEQGMTPAYVLKDTNNLDNKFIYENDLMPIVKEAFKTPLEKERQKALDDEKNITKKLYENVHNLPKDTRPNIILDYSLTTDDPVKTIQTSIYDIVSKRLKKKEARSYKDIIRFWREEHDKIQGSLLKRINGYG